MAEYKIASTFLDRELQFRAMTRKWITARHAGFLKSEKYLKGAKVLRHPKGETHDRNSLEYLWSDAIWCQDCTLDPLMEFFELDDDEFEDTDNPVCHWANEIFDDEFKAVLPELAHVLSA